MIWNVEKCNQLITDPPAPTTLRVFFYLALNQHEVTGFVRMSKKTLAKILGMDAKSLYTALRWLYGNYIVHETRHKGYYEFMVSPYYVEWGENKKARLDEWNRRWADHWKRIARRKSHPPA